jgi:hypothetical protein
MPLSFNTIRKREAVRTMVALIIPERPQSHRTLELLSEMARDSLCLVGLTKGILMVIKRSIMKLCKSVTKIIVEESFSSSLSNSSIWQTN